MNDQPTPEDDRRHISQSGGIDRRIIFNYEVEDNGSLDEVYEGTNSHIIDFTFAWNCFRKQSQDK
jgi:hypothetical protein